jgi:hypothetical protein
MRIGITGSSVLSAREARTVNRILRGILSCYGPEDELHHGAARGVDQIAKEIGEHYGMKVVPHPPQEKRWDGAKGYRARNVDIVNASDKVYAIHSPNSTTGGTIWTYNYAEGVGKPVEWIEIPDDKRKV